MKKLYFTRAVKLAALLIPIAAMVLFLQSAFFYHDDYDATELYYFTAELDAVPSFDGDKKQYEILLNDYLVLEPTILFRMFSFRVYINFIDVDSSMLCETYFDVSIKFLSDKTDFRIEMYGTENSQYVERYIEHSGFELFINEVKESK